MRREKCFENIFDISIVAALEQAPPEPCVVVSASLAALAECATEKRATRTSYSGWSFVISRARFLFSGRRGMTRCRTIIATEWRRVRNVRWRLVATSLVGGKGYFVVWANTILAPFPTD